MLDVKRYPADRRAISLFQREKHSQIATVLAILEQQIPAGPYASRRTVRYFFDVLGEHLALEEGVVFPAWQRRHPEDNEKIEQFIQEHWEIRRSGEALRLKLEAPFPDKDELGQLVWMTNASKALSQLKAVVKPHDTGEEQLWPIHEKVARAKNNRGGGKVIFIGLGTHSRGQLKSVPWEKVPMDIRDAIEAGHVEEYDMQSWPERGDALDHITKDTRAVFAFHLFGISERDRSPALRTPAGYFYNRENHKLMSLCKSLGVPLYVWGDQPRGDAPFQTYTNPASFKKLVSTRWTEACHAVGLDVKQVQITIGIGEYPHFKKKRGYGVAMDHTKGKYEIRFAKKILVAPVHRADGLLRHEIGHIVDMIIPSKKLDSWALGRQVRLPSTPERRADAIALAIWGTPLRYDEDLVQSTTEGVAVRPKHLGL